MKFMIVYIMKLDILNFSFLKFRILVWYIFKYMFVVFM